MHFGSPRNGGNIDKMKTTLKPITFLLQRIVLFNIFKLMYEDHELIIHITFLSYRFKARENRQHAFYAALLVPMKS